MRCRGLTIKEFILAMILASLVAVLVVPYYSLAREKATQKSTMADMHRWAQAISCYTADHASPPTNPGGALHYRKAILRECVPYLKAVRLIDWWGTPLRIWTGEKIHVYGVNTQSEKDFLIASFGRMGFIEEWTYDAGNPSSGYFETETLEDFEKDLILWNSTFIRRPK